MIIDALLKCDAEIARAQSAIQLVRNGAFVDPLGLHGTSSDKHLIGLTQSLGDWHAEKALILSGARVNGYSGHVPTIPYSEFKRNKREYIADAGYVEDVEHSKLFPFQRDIVKWALRRGRAAIFAACGTGKTPMQLHWADSIVKRTKKPVIIFTPLAVAPQTVREGEKFGIPVNICVDRSEIKLGVNVTNYEKLHHFISSDFDGIVLDESSILKSLDGRYRQLLTEFASTIPFRLACTATPAPNDIAEFANHADFLGIMSPKEIYAMFFKNDGNDTHKWRLKHYARENFWEWLASWSVSLNMPSDLGYSDKGFILPPLNITPVIVPGAFNPESVKTLGHRNQARKASLESRCLACAKLVANNPDVQWGIWCGLNAESKLLTELIPYAIEVTGSMPDHVKKERLLGFIQGKYSTLVTKVLIAGFGLNMQNCFNWAFVGLSDSYEQYHQAVRRGWRFGQENPVNAYIIYSDDEGVVVENVQRKEKESAIAMSEIIKRTSLYTDVSAKREETPDEVDVKKGPNRSWAAYLGDSIELCKKALRSNSVGLSVFSPPFPSMYVYTNSPSDVGNVKNIGELIDHFKYLVPGLLDVTMPGRSCCIHLTQAVAFKGVDGYIGIKDFRGLVIKAMEDGGWIYYGEVTIDKNPQVKAIRTKDSGLLFKSLATDSARMHMALADYILQFKKPGENPTPILAGKSERYGNTEGWITSEEWIEWAAPVWYRRRGEYITNKQLSDWARKKLDDDVYDEFTRLIVNGMPETGGIKETDTLSVRMARDGNDERHLCPLQLGVIERCVKLWSNPEDLVFDPFGGVGSTGVKALELGRRAVTMELKRSYWEAACEYMKMSESKYFAMQRAQKKG